MTIDDGSGTAARLPPLAANELPVNEPAESVAARNDRSLSVPAGDIADELNPPSSIALPAPAAMFDMFVIAVRWDGGDVTPSVEIVPASSSTPLPVIVAVTPLPTLGFRNSQRTSAFLH
jgi:hypothetical protein